MNNLVGKKILFIGIGFYDYETIIKDILTERGAKVAYINSSKRTFLWRLTQRMKLKKISSAIRSNYIINELYKKRDNDIVFVIKGENLFKRELNVLQENNVDAKYILYLWDSLIRHNNINFLLDFFKNVWSFDRVDCEKNPHIKFRPLFYRVTNKPKFPVYDLSFVGWMHSDRLNILRHLKDRLQGRPYYLKLYMGAFQYFVKRYLTRSLKSSDDDLIITKPISYDELQEIIKLSKTVLDISHVQQSGLTMRAIETLANGVHLLTTNSDIINYKDISSSCYTILERGSLLLPVLEEKCNCTIDLKYSIHSFIEDIFDIE